MTSLGQLLAMFLLFVDSHQAYMCLICLYDDAFSGSRTWCAGSMHLAMMVYFSFQSRILTVGTDGAHPLLTVWTPWYKLEGGGIYRVWLHVSVFSGSWASLTGLTKLSTTPRPLTLAGCKLTPQSGASQLSPRSILASGQCYTQRVCDHHSLRHWKASRVLTSSQGISTRP